MWNLARHCCVDPFNLLNDLLRSGILNSRISSSSFFNYKKYDDTNSSCKKKNSNNDQRDLIARKTRWSFATSAAKSRRRERSACVAKRVRQAFTHVQRNATRCIGTDTGPGSRIRFRSTQQFAYEQRKKSLIFKKNQFEVPIIVGTGLNNTDVIL